MKLFFVERLLSNYIHFPVSNRHFLLKLFHKEKIQKTQFSTIFWAVKCTFWKMYWIRSFNSTVKYRKLLLARLMIFCILQGSTSSTSSVGSSSSTDSMEVSTRNGLSTKAPPPPPTNAAPGTPNKHVNFGGSGNSEEKKREKFLTAKYGAHQMALIRKRLRVEMWMYERLQEIYGAVSFYLQLNVSIWNLIPIGFSNFNFPLGWHRNRLRWSSRPGGWRWTQNIYQRKWKKNSFKLSIMRKIEETMASAMCSWLADVMK